MVSILNISSQLQTLLFKPLTNFKNYDTQVIRSRYLRNYLIFFFRCIIVSI